MRRFGLLMPGGVPPSLRIVDDGRPMPLKDAIRGATNRAGKPLAVLARLGMRLTSSARFGQRNPGLHPGYEFIGVREPRRQKRRNAQRIEA